ncbi:MAG: hypothetical protein H6718_23655 [Polyangiaceae bacterium]|nr:hypothetical protein [Polyangiaceae bacterium]
MKGLNQHPDRTDRPTLGRSSWATRQWLVRCARALAAFVASWVLFGAAPALAAENMSQLPPPAPMCGADGTTVEAPPPLRSASGDELSAPCSEDLMRLVGAKSDQPSKDALWRAQAQVDHAVILLGAAQVAPQPVLLTPTPAPELGPVEQPTQIYRPPRS